MFDCLEQLELFAACFLQLRRTLVDKIPNRLLFVVNKDGILLFLCAQIPAVSINFLLRFLKKIDDFVAVVHIGGCCFQRMNQSAVRIHADVRSHFCPTKKSASLPVRGAWIEIP